MEFAVIGINFFYVTIAQLRGFRCGMDHDLGTVSQKCYATEISCELPDTLTNFTGCASKFVIPMKPLQPIDILTI